jgi:hypothetical protein
MPKRARSETSALLINEPPLQVLPTLALKIGLNEALILQQVHWWLHHSEHFFDGQSWLYNTYEDWHKQFPFFSTSTIRRAIYQLELDGLLVSTTKYNRHPEDRNKWYSINMAKLNELLDPPSAQNEQTPAQNEQTPQTPAQNEQPLCSHRADPCSEWADQQRDPQREPENPSPQTPPPAGEGPGCALGEEGTADAPATLPPDQEERWSITHEEFAELLDLLDHRGRSYGHTPYRERDPPSADHREDGGGP